MSSTDTIDFHKLSDAEWKKRLTPEQYQVLRHHGTERPGSCALNYENAPAPSLAPAAASLCSSRAMKFESGTGWPSFTDPLPGSVETTVDSSHGMTRTEVRCSRCDGAISATSSSMARRLPVCGTA